MSVAAPKPYPFQRQDVQRMEALGLRCLLAWDMGLGKTVVTLAALRRNPRARPAAVVCPASVKHQWEAEAARFGLRAEVLDGQQPPAGAAGGLARPGDLLVVNYDILPGWVDTLRALGPRTVVLDEPQMIGNLAAARTQAAQTLGRGVPHRIGLSGTPLTNRPAELWPALNLIRPDLFPSFWQFAARFCRPRLIRGRWEYRGARNLRELHGRLAGVMIRRRKADVLDDLPALRRRVVPVPLRRPGEYAAAEADLVRWLRAVDPARVRSALRAGGLARVGHLLRLAARLKLRAVVGWANGFLAGGEKLVLFAVHRRMIEALQRRVQGRSVVVDGSVTGARRREAVARFRRDPACRLLIGNVRAAGTGVDGLQDACRTAAFAEMWWSPGVMRQAADRIHRIGQRRGAEAVFLVARGTVEERLCEVLQTKQRVIDETLDGAATGDLDVLDLLAESMITEGEER